MPHTLDFNARPNMKNPAQPHVENPARLHPVPTIDPSIVALPSPEPVEISCIIPCFNEEDNIAHAVTRVDHELLASGHSYEIILVDDGSRDQTVARARALLADYPLRIICFSRNFGKEDAITAGMKKAHGRAVIIIDADLQEPVETIHLFIKHWKAGYHMVYAVRQHRDDESWLKNAFSNGFYWLLNQSSSVSIPAHARDFRLMDRKVVDALAELPERNRFMKGLFSWVGFKTKPIPVEIQSRHRGRSKFNYRRLFALAATALTAFTNLPLRIWMLIGALISTLSIGYAFWITLHTLIWGSQIPGWSTITVAVLFLGGIQILSIGVLGEYLARISNEVKGRPGYIIAEEFQPPANGSSCLP